MFETIIRLADRVVLTITPVLNNVVAALIIIFIGFAIGKISGGFVLKVLRDGNIDQTGQKLLRRKFALAKTVSIIVSYFFYIGSIVIALNTVRVTSLVIGTVVFLFAFVIIISLAITMKDLLPNLFAGIKMRKLSKFSVGRTLSFQGVKGIIQKRSLVHIVVARKNGDLFIFPNKLFRDKI